MTLPFQQPAVIAYSHLLCQSYAHWMKRPLTDSDDIPHTLYHAPFALVSHGNEPDPVFCYANLAAQNLWGISWDEFISMPSRLSAEPVASAERQRLLDEAALKGYVDNYEGVRITKGGKRFKIKNTILWNVVDDSAVRRGQAALIKGWEWL